MADKEQVFAPLGFRGTDPDEPTLQLNEDGEVDEVLEDEDPEDEDLPEDWLENLADERLPEDKRTSIASEIIELVEYDKTVREPWRKLMVRGLEMMGLKRGDIDDGPFPGAATVVHPIMTEAIIQFWARALPELFPSEGPVKGKVLGKQSEERTASAERVQEHMNYQCLFEDKGYRREKSKQVFLLGAYGSAFMKSYRNTTHDRTEGICVEFEDFIVPYTATSLETAPRYTHRMRKTRNEVKKKQKSGEWYDCELSTPVDEEQSDEQAAKDDVERVEPSGNEKDARHEIYETYIEMDLGELDPYADEDGIELPYIVTVEKESQKVLAIRRNWRPEDEMREQRVYFTAYEFLPGFGFYGLGLFHIIGTLSESATGALRAILDGSATASLQGGFITRDLAGKLGVDGDKLVVEPGVYKVVDALAEELKNGVYTPDFKPPSNVLFEVLGFLVDSGRRLASTTETMTGEGDNTGPVGTTVALIEQGMKVFSTIHQSMHMSMAHELRVRFDLNREFAPEDGYAYEVHGDERYVYAADYGPQTDVVPVSDPNIFSTTQRLAIAQATYQLAQENPDIYDKLEVHRRMHQAMKTPDYEDLLIDPDKLVPLDPVAENQCIITMKPIRVFPHQDHASHIAVHLAFFQNPGFGGHPEVMPLIEAGMKAHIAEHLAALHAQQVSQMLQAAGMPLPIETIDFGAMRPEELANPEQVQIGAIVAQLAEQIMQAPGLPPPPEEEQAAGQSPEELQDIHMLKMKHADESHQQSLQHKDEMFQLDQKIKGAGGMSDIKRKDAATMAEQERRDLEARAEEVRKDEALVAEIARQDAEHEQEMEQAEDQAALDLAAKKVAAAESREEQAADNEFARGEKAKDSNLSRVEKVVDSEVGRSQKAKDAEFTREQKAKDSEQTRKQRDAEGKQKIEQTKKQTDAAIKAKKQASKQPAKGGRDTKSR